MSTNTLADTPNVDRPAGAASGGKRTEVEEFSPKKLALIDRLITAHVAAVTARLFGQVDAPSTSTTVETGEFLLS